MQFMHGAGKLAGRLRKAIDSPPLLIQFGCDLVKPDYQLVSMIQYGACIAANPGNFLTPGSSSLMRRRIWPVAPSVFSSMRVNRARF